MFDPEDWEKFHKEYEPSRKQLTPIASLLPVAETMRFQEEQTASDKALNIGKSIYNGAVSQTVGDALHGLQALRDYNEAILNEEAPERMQMSEEARSILDTAANAEFLQPYEVRADSGAERLAYDLAQGGGQILGQVAVGALTGGYGNLPAMGLQIAGNEYKQLREQGVDVKTAAEAGAFNALVQTPLEYIGFKKITKAFPANTLFKQRLRMFAEDAVTEGITEFLQEYPEQASIIWAMQHKGEPLKDTDTMVQEILQTAADNFDKITPDALYSGTIGAVLGSGAGGVHMALDNTIRRNMEREAHNIRMDEEERRIEKIKESKVNPPYAAAVINDNMQGETVYVDGEALNAYAQAHDVQKVADSLGVTVDDIQTAAENGDTVDVKLGNFEATGAAFDGFFQAVKDDTAFEDGGYTVNKDKLEQERDKAEEEQRDALRAEQDRLLDEMKKAGVNSTTAANAVALITSRAINTNNPVEMMKQLSFRYGGDGSTADGFHQFAGEKAKTSDTLKLNEAQRMAEGNASDEDIYKATGWLKGKDGKWRFEIPDNLDKIDLAEIKNGNEDSFGYTLESIYDNPALYEAYPWLKDIPVVKSSELSMDTRGAVTNRYGTFAIELNAKRLDDVAIKNTLVHEIQHLIQRQEGFASGGSPESIRSKIELELERLQEVDWDKLSDDAKEFLNVRGRYENTLLGIIEADEETQAKYKAELDKYTELVPEAERKTASDVENKIRALKRALREHGNDPQALYWNLGGEQEARTAANRANGHTKYAKAKRNLVAAQVEFEKLKASLPEQEQAQIDKYLAAKEAALKANEEEDQHAGKPDEEEYFKARVEAWAKEAELEESLPENVKDALRVIGNAEWALSFGEEALEELPKPHDKFNAIIVFDKNATPYQLVGKNARGANLEALNKAYGMDWAGKTPAEIFEATGWFKGKDGLWRYEIPDNLNKIDFTSLNKRGKSSLQKVYDNPALYEAYPFLKRINIVAAEYEDDTEGMAYGRTIEISKKELAEKPEEAKKTLIHEIQHLIQRREGFAVGGSSDNARELLGGLLKRDKRLASMTDDELYFNLAGEQEARYAESRAATQTDLDNAIEEREDAEERLASAKDKKAQEQAKHDLGKAKLKEAYFRRKLQGVPAPHDSDAIVTFGNETVAKMPTQSAETALESFLQSAWHGSPHKFAQFDLGAIGTGEGAQVHGWGLYFAQNREVAEGYKKRLSDSSLIVEYNGIPYNGLGMFWSQVNGDDSILPMPERFALTYIAKAEGDKAKAKKELQKRLKEDRGTIYENDIESAIELVEKGDFVIKSESLGSLFEVEIPDNDVLLDEQKTLSEQSEKVQRAAREIIADRLGNKDGVLSYVENKYGKELADKIREHFSDGKSLDYKEPIYKDGRSAEEHAKDYYDENGEFDPLKALLSEEPAESGESLREEIERLPDGDYILARIKLNDIASQSLLEYNEFWVNRAFNTTGLGFYKSLSSFLGSDRSASELLNDFGIKGITYEGGRDGRCFVVFDDAAINIIDTYNKQVNEGGTLVNKGAYNPTTNIITLFKGADASTVIHETWHFFVEQMWNSLQDGTASEQTQKDFDALLKYAGMTREEWANADTEGRRAAHEKLAEAGETYIMEGRAPSYDLRRVFKNFAKWLKNVYRVISRSENAAELTDEVREVFDRMLAVEDDIARMERVNGYFAKLPDVITDNMSDETRMKVEDFIEKARDKAVGILTRRALSNYTKKRREEVQKFKDEIRPSVEAEVNNMPVYACGYDKKDVERYNKLKEQQAGIGVWAAEDFIERAFPAEGPYGDELKNELALTAMFRSHDNWGKGLRELRAEYEAQAQEILKPALDVLESGMGQGVDIIKDEETGRYIRASRNAQWYRDFYKEHKRKPNKGELREMARLLIAGDVNAPQVEGWTPSTEEEAQAMQAESERLAEIERHIAAADAIKDRLVEIEKNYKATNGGDMFLLEAEVTAEQYGYSSADEMMKDIEASPTKEEAVRQRVNERVQELSPENERAYYENAVRESLYNEDEALLIGVEQQLIEEYAAKERAKQTEKDAKQTARAIEKQRENEVKAAVAEGKKLYAKNMAEIAAAKRQQAKNAAKEDLAKMNVKDATRTSKFITAERKAAIKSAQLLLKKDYAGALAQKNLQAYWHAMAAESIKVARRKAQYDKFLKTQQKAKPEAWLNETHFGAVSQLFIRMGIAKPVHMAAAENAPFKNLVEYAEAMGQQFDCVDMPEWIINGSMPIDDINALTLEQYEDVINTIKNIKAIVKAQKGVNMFNAQEAWAGTKEKIISMLAPLKTLWEPNPNKVSQPSFKEKQLASLETIDTLCEMLDGGHYGWFSQHWNNLMKRCQDREYDCREAYDNAETEAVKKWLPDKAAEVAAGEEVYYKELGTSVSKHTLVRMLMNLGNKQNSQRLCETIPVGFEQSGLWIMPDETMGVSREEAAEATRNNLIDFLGSVLTKEDVEYAQRRINAAEMFWGDRVELDKRTKGFAPKKVEAMPVVLEISGEQVVMHGGYFPLLRYGETGSHSAAAEVQPDEELQGRRIRTYHTNTSSSKARTNAKYPVDLRLGTERNWIYESIHDLCWREAMGDFRRVLNDQDVYGLLKSKIGVARMELFKELLEVAADSSNSKPLTQAEKAFVDVTGWMTSRTSNALIMCSLKVTSQNFADSLLYGNAVEGYTMADNISALGRYMLKWFNPSTQKEMQDFVFSKSAYMKERSLIPDVTIRDLINENKSYKWEKVVRETTTKMFAYTDNATAIPNWLQAYNKKINEGWAEQDAIDFADAVVRRVKGSSRNTEVSSMQRSKVLKPFTMFQSFFNARLNEFLRMERYATKQWSEGQKTEAFSTVASYVMGKVLAQAMLATALALENPFGIDDEDKWPNLIKELKSQTFSMGGPLGQVASGFVGVAAGMREFDYRMSAIESTINKGLGTIKKIKSGKATKAEKVESVTNFAGLVSGVPAQFTKIFWNAFDIVFNNMKPEIGDIMRRRPKKERKNKKRKD